METFKLVVGLVMTVVLLGIAGARLLFLYRVGASAQPVEPGRVGRSGDIARAEVVEVAGQRKLLRWTAPGLAHARRLLGVRRPRADDRRGVRGAVHPDLPHPGHRELAGPGLRRGPLRRPLPAGRRRVHGHPAARVAQGARPVVAVLRVAPRRGLVHPLHDRQRRVDADAGPRRPDQRRGRQRHRRPAVPAAARSSRSGSPRCSPRSGRPPTRSSRRSPCCWPWPCCSASPSS